MWSSSRETSLTPEQQARYDASPHHFRIHYQCQHNGGFGHGMFHVGAQQSSLTDQDCAEAIEDIRRVVISNTQADGVSIDVSTLVVRIVQVDPLPARRS